MVDGFGMGRFVNWCTSGDGRLADEIGADDFELVHREIACFEGLDSERGADGFVHFFDGCADGFRGEEFDDLQGRQRELLFKGGDFAAVIEEEEEVAGVLA